MNELMCFINCRRFVLSVALFCALMTSAVQVFAQSETNFTWTGAGLDRRWSNPDNWDLNEVPWGEWHRVRFMNVDDSLRVVDVDMNVEVSRLYIECTAGAVGYVFNSIEGGDITFQNIDSGLRSKISDSVSTLFDTVFNVSVSFPTSNSRMHKSANGREFIFNYPAFSTVQLNLAAHYRFRSTSGNLWLNQVGLSLILDTPAGQTNIHAMNITGSGYRVVKEGEGLAVYQGGTKSYTAETLVSAGRLDVNATVINSSLFIVESGAMLAGTGTIAPVTVEDNGVLGAGSADETGMLTLNGLTLSDESVLRLRLDAPGDPHDILNVAGDLVLDGLLDIVDLGGLDVGEYTLITYTGTLTDNGLGIGSAPGGYRYQIIADTPGVIKVQCTPPHGTLFYIR